MKVLKMVQSCIYCLPLYGQPIECMLAKPVNITKCHHWYLCLRMFLNNFLKHDKWSPNQTSEKEYKNHASMWIIIMSDSERQTHQIGCKQNRRGGQDVKWHPVGVSVMMWSLSHRFLLHYARLCCGLWRCEPMFYLEWSSLMSSRQRSGM